MVRRIKEIPLLDCLTPKGSFYLFVEVKDVFGKSYQEQRINDVDDFARYLLEDFKVALVPGTGFGSPCCVRLSFATSMENIKKGLERIENFIKELE